jgi:hypothetical protein
MWLHSGRSCSKATTWRSLGSAECLSSRLLLPRRRLCSRAAVASWHWLPHRACPGSRGCFQAAAVSVPTRCRVCLRLPAARPSSLRRRHTPLKPLRRRRRRTFARRRRRQRRPRGRPRRETPRGSRARRAAAAASAAGPHPPTRPPRALRPAPRPTAAPPRRLRSAARLGPWRRRGEGAAA